MATEVDSIASAGAGPAAGDAKVRVVAVGASAGGLAATTELVRMMDTERGFQMATQFIEAESTRRQSAIDKIAGPVS